MANNRKKKKINSKQQVNRISFIISGIYFVCVLIKGIILKPVGDFAFSYWLMGCFGGTIFIYFMFRVIFILKLQDKIDFEKEQEIRQYLDKYLSNECYTQVYFRYENCNSIRDMIIKILQKEGCKFYAKFIENNIHLIVKDKHNEKVYSAEIKNLNYFKSNFKFDE